MSAKVNKSRREAWAAAQAARAVSFTAVMFLGYPEGVDKRHASSLEGARRLRADMLAEYADKNFGRGVMIYAVTEDNVTIHLE